MLNSTYTFYLCCFKVTICAFLNLCIKLKTQETNNKTFMVEVAKYFSNIL